MISVIGIFLYMLITCYLLGFCCYELLDGFRRKQEKAFHEEPHRTWTGCVYAGVAFTVFYAQMFSIFYKVGLFANVLLLILAAAGVIFYRDRFAEELKRLWNQKNIKRAMVYALLFLLYAYGTSRGIEHYDTGLYHAQSIRWIEEYGVSGDWETCTAGWLTTARHFHGPHCTASVFWEDSPFTAEQDFWHGFFPWYV